MSTSYWLSRGFVVLFFLTSLVLAIVYWEELISAMTDYLEWVRDNPVISPFSLLAVVTVSTMLFIPGSVMLMGAGWALN